MASYRGKTQAGVLIILSASICAGNRNRAASRSVVCVDCISPTIPPRTLRCVIAWLGAESKLITDWLSFLLSHVGMDFTFRFEWISSKPTG
ncbi:hypothetical protein PF005_g6207 [Phytophthora fragariae]|uniref:Uncharacterized protein n=2 Tax=Phytophthora TaxID=4783 RepID=A0A6A3FNS3_9STRA|nr:hypothetical protein PF003_g16558 [Phytophthora fragariae]KAE9039148.1 hypothetical protein PR002_g5648 [Phytophthora rubi]KAE8943418.1 hypothetical protein PF009_g6876 [Phytophthora fragariae]KAE9009514.1 hypothetical protein PF011_g10249 [Phytophthora fragariae]KAE9044452.1 hypothetical protein PR001_g5351 [Phytophthora rubi]